VLVIVLVDLVFADFLHRFNVAFALFPAVNSINDSTQHVALETACQHTLHMWRVQENSILVVAVDNKVEREEYMPHVLDALESIEQGGWFAILCPRIFAPLIVLLCSVLI
jgi:hypothetical protein